ncbi:MAG: hypothetical protein AVDCRST_MAG22-3865 [uncultured Rubrobacteraceae bacterium]|uniref:Alkaline phosphatase n=1 Tax=uncultured Rubrobacteraceae bacterium TaxID=349277 RepID=A0A6J4QAG8_9ACTN|nr:MAG: hypothetical protein AVDCRST_MAG22-3865 [uncultured Rubrobacteraceae bacterium]
MGRIAIVVLTLALALSSSTAAFAALRVGTNSAEVLTGTHSADLLNGKGAGDALRGLAANDVYYFADGYGQDTLVERAQHKVGGKVLPGGKDSLNFSRVTSAMSVYLTPEWPTSGDSYGNQGVTTDSDSVKHRVALGTSPVENVTGGSGGTDFIGGGGASNTLRPGGGPNNTLRDFGGWVGGEGLPAIPNASGDTYSGFGSLPSGGRADVADWGGGTDRLVLPGGASDYHLDSVDLDGVGATEESLQVYDPRINASIFVYGHFGEYSNWTRSYGMHGQIERVQFADGVFDTAQAPRLQARNLGATTGIAREAERAAEEARSDAPTDPTRPG